jgi:serine-type D-Ala-D-Ala carboxypeptidase/endopeptidase
VTYAARDLFVMEAVSAEMHFERDSEGHVVAMLLRQGGVEQRGVRE